MHTTSPAIIYFSTFHTNRTGVLVEITSQILEFVVADANMSPLGGGVGTHRVYHPLASVSRDLRAAFLNISYAPELGSRGAAPSYLHIGEALEFDDLRTLTAFFQQGPGQEVALLRRVRYVSISYLDHQAFRSGPLRTTEFAFEAFELLYTSWHLMRVSWLQLCLPSSGVISSVDDPGIWSLLKIRGLDHLTISGPYRCIASGVRAALKARTYKKKLFPWRPLGMEDPGPHNWTDTIHYRDDQLLWQQQYERLNARYKYLQDRKTIAVRRASQRVAYRKRQTRWPMLFKQRRSQQRRNKGPRKMA